MKNVASLIIVTAIIFLAGTAQADEITRDQWISMIHEKYPDMSDRTHGHENVLLAIGRGTQGDDKFFWALRADEKGILKWEFSKGLNILTMSSMLWVEKFCSPSDKCNRWEAAEEAVSQLTDANPETKMSVVMYY